MLKNVIFDIGNVLMGFDAQNYGAVYFKDPLQAKKLQEAINSFDLWNKCDLGLWPVEQVIEEFAQSMTGQEELARKAIYASIDFVLHGDWAIPWLQELKAKGYGVYFLSNYNIYLRELKPEILDFLPYMDGGVFSCDVHMVKPEREIYDYFFKKYSLKPEECVFLDDRVANIETGRSLGMAGIVVKTPEQAKLELKALLGY